MWLLANVADAADDLMSMTALPGSGGVVDDVVMHPELRHDPALGGNILARLSFTA